MGHITSNPRLFVSRSVKLKLLPQAGLPKQVSLEQALTQVLLVKVVGCLSAGHRCRRDVLYFVALEFSKCGLRVPALISRSSRFYSLQLSLRSEAVTLYVLSFIGELFQRLLNNYVTLRL